jgi:type III restriction enzyme
MNPGELACAAALDELGFPWMRNPAGRDGYSIDLPVYGSGSQRFFPDFLLFAGTRILAIDPKGGQLLNDAIRDKLLAPLRTNDGRTIEILLVSSGTWAVETDGGVRQTSRTEGVTSFTRDRLTLTAQPHQGWEAWAQSLAVG